MRSQPTPFELAETLSGRHRELVNYLRSRLPCNADAQDIAQEAYLRLLRLSDDRLIQHPEAYLFRIASNLVHEFWLSSRTVTGDGATDPDELAADERRPEDIANQKQALDALGRAIELLPPIQQTTILLHRRDGKTYDEIAAELGISRDMVKKHLSKALARCRQYMELRQHEC